MQHQTFRFILISSIFAFIGAQCISSNDIRANETNIRATIENLVDGSSAFGLDLLRTLNKGQNLDKNAEGVFFSPLSIWSALMVAYMGARGATELEMRNVLGLGTTDKVAVWEAFINIRNGPVYDNSLQSIFKPAKESYNSANRIYFQQGTAFKDCMKDLLGNDISFLDFANAPSEAINTINSYVQAETNNTIVDLIPPGSLNALTRMVIANAVYFKDTWLNQFDPKNTARRRFTTTSRQDIFVNMMKVRGTFMYGHSPELQCNILELPYSGNTLSMMILLPKNRYNGINFLANALTPQRLRALISDMYPREVTVQIPKFKVENSFELSTVLQSMGLRSLFDTRKVDLSGFTGQRDFTVDAVLHKSFIDVNEEGTEAAAATAILSSRSAKQLDMAFFVADYPFVYCIIDNTSNMILFLGTVRKPPEFTKSA